MKATGIVRRIDDLGRVVIPKEIRRTIRIREGDPLEIFTGSGGEIIFKKYSPIGELSEYASKCADVIHSITGKQAIICDRDHIIYATGSLKRELTGRRVSSDLEELMLTRKNYSHTSQSTAILPIESADYPALSIAIIIAAGDVYGAVILISTDGSYKYTETDQKLTEATAMFLGKQLEE